MSYMCSDLMSYPMIIPLHGIAALVTSELREYARMMALQLLTCHLCCSFVISRHVV